MDVFEFDSVKAKKITAMLRYHRFGNLSKLLRIVELCVGLIFLSWTLVRLPFAIIVSGNYFRQASAINVSPLFIFLLGNVIVLTLLAKSDKFTQIVNIGETHLYEESIKNNEYSVNFDSSPPVPSPEDDFYQDKQINYEVNNPTTPNSDIGEAAIVSDPHTASDTKAYRRSQSENLKRESSDEHFGKLRRSKTEMSRKVANPGEIPAETVYFVDELSNEEFQQTIDAFIAKHKHVKFHQSHA